MGRKHAAVIAVTDIMTKILDAIGSTDQFKIKNIARTETSEPYREIRVTCPAIYDACRGEDKDDIYAVVKATVPNVIGIYEKRYVRGNKAKSTNNAELDGLMIHLSLD